ILPEFQFKDSGNASTSQISARLYLWLDGQTDYKADYEWKAGSVVLSEREEGLPTIKEAGFATVFTWSSALTLSPTEVRNLPTLGMLNSLTKPARAKLRVFYGVEKPAEADFTVCRNLTIRAGAENIC